MKSEEYNQLLNQIIQRTKEAKRGEENNTHDIPITISCNTHQKISQTMHFLNKMSEIEGEPHFVSPITESDIIESAIIFFSETHRFKDFFCQSNTEHINNFHHKELIEDLRKISLLGKPLQNNLKNYMHKRNISQKKLAELTGIDKSNLSIYMNNKSQPSVTAFFIIWFSLGTPLLREVFQLD